MRLRNVRGAALAATLVVGGLAAADVVVTVGDAEILGLPPGSEQAIGIDANSSGTVVGYAYFRDAAGFLLNRAVRSVNGGPPVDLQPSDATTRRQSFAGGVSEDGVAVGYRVVGRDDWCPGCTQLVATRWEADGRPTTLPPLGGLPFRHGEARAISPSGRFAVGYSHDANGFMRATRWDGTTPSALLCEPSASCDWAFALVVNDAGDAAGYGWDGSRYRAIRWRAGGAVEILPDPPGYDPHELQPTDVRAITSSGDVYVNVYNFTLGQYLVYRWGADGTPVEIVPSGSSSFRYVYDANDAGLALVYLCEPTTCGLHIVRDGQATLVSTSRAWYHGMSNLAGQSARAYLAGYGWDPTFQHTGFARALVTLGSANRPPTVSLLAEWPATEGQKITISATASDPDGNTNLTYEWDLNDDKAFETTTATPNVDFTAPDNGSYVVRVRAKDSEGATSDIAHTVVNAGNAPPTATFSNTGPVNEGTAFTLSLTSVSDVAADIAKGFSYRFNCGTGWSDWGASPSASCPTDNDGPRDVKGEVRDADLGVGGPYDASVVVNNVTPTATFPAVAPLNEGSSFTLKLTDVVEPSSVDRAILAYRFDCGAGTGFTDWSGTPQVTCTTSDNGTRAVKAEVRDDDASSGYSGSVTVNNVGPAFGALEGIPAGPIAAGTSLTIGASFTDPGLGDTHEGGVEWDSGRGFTTSGVTTVSPTASQAGRVSATAALEAGVYTLTLRVQDDDLASDTRSVAPSYVVVYDPSAGFVTGGGWINSAAGDCQLNAACASASGKATFGFVSKYLKGATTPSGNTEFQFQAGGLRFKSSSYDWLVVASARAQYKGEGTVNGGGRYRFILTAIDGQEPGGGGVDRFRIKIWSINADGTDGGVVYDNQFGKSEDSDDATVLGGGSIVIHNK